MSSDKDSEIREQIRTLDPEARQELLKTELQQCQREMVEAEKGSLLTAEYAGERAERIVRRMATDYETIGELTTLGIVLEAQDRLAEQDEPLEDLTFDIPVRITPHRPGEMDESIWGDRFGPRAGGCIEICVGVPPVEVCYHTDV